MHNFIKLLKPQHTYKTDIVASGIILSAILMFVGTGSIVMPKVVESYYDHGSGPDNVIAAAMMLNIALIIFGWNRYRELANEIVIRRAAEETAKAIACTDPLTKCLNRRTLSERTSKMIAQASDIDKNVAFMMLDVDNFKTINDVQGHESGDRVLVEIAKRLEHAVPQDALVSRLGGDEFACAFIFDPEAPQQVERVCEDIIDCISLPISGPQNEVNVTTSIGVAYSDSHTSGFDVIMRRADIAMYFSKKNGRNRFTWFEQNMEDEVHVRNEIESAMRAGIAKGEFVPFYEQQVDLQTGGLIGFEVLARWESPELGNLLPEIFIPIAEDSGLINELSEAVMEQAMRDACHWDSALTISVNVSPVQLRDPWLAQKIVKLLVKTGLPANRLEVEITETCLFENVDMAQTIINSLKNQGVRVALDDFGTGYSSLAHLRSLPFDRIKIDRSFVASVHENPESAAIVEAIAGLGKSMNLPITAEGIEDEAVVMHLQSLGCMKGQGFLYGRPQSTDMTHKMLAEKNLLNGNHDADLHKYASQEDASQGIASENRMAAITPEPDLKAKRSGSG